MFDYQKKDIKKYRKAAEYYRPKKIDLLFIAESPPFANEGKELRYFYFKKHFAEDYLFNSIVEVILPKEYDKLKKSYISKEDILIKFKKIGCFLIDACEFPINSLSETERSKIILKDFNNLITRTRSIINKGTKIILIKKNIYNIFLKKQNYLDLNIINPGFGELKDYSWKANFRSNSLILPFPSHGRQPDFKGKLKEILNYNRIKF